MTRLSLGLWTRQPATVPFSLLGTALFPHGHLGKKKKQPTSLKFFFVYFFHKNKSVCVPHVDFQRRFQSGDRNDGFSVKRMPWKGGLFLSRVNWSRVQGGPAFGLLSGSQKQEVNSSTVFGGLHTWHWKIRHLGSRHVFSALRGMRDGCNCQLFVEMHIFLIIKALSVLICASGLSLCWGSTRMVRSRITGVPGLFLAGFCTHSHPSAPAGSPGEMGGEEENQVGALMVYLDKNVWERKQKTTTTKSLFNVLCYSATE